MSVASLTLFLSKLTELGEMEKMKSLINYKMFTCGNCGLDYQGVYPYLHDVLGVVCNDCLNCEVINNQLAQS